MSAEPPVSDLAIDAHVIRGASARHVGAVVSTGSEIVWSGGATEADRDLYRYVPGALQPELLFANSRDSILSAVAGSSAGYVFTDERWSGDQQLGWRLWFLAPQSINPVLLDQSTDDLLPSPTVAMSDGYIAWEVVHGTWEDRLNELRIASVTDPTRPKTLLSVPGRDEYLEFPALWENELWYGIVDNDWDAGTERPRIEMLDLRNPAAPPQVFGADQRAFMPAAGRDVVAWKSGGQTGSSALNSGVLTIHRRDLGRHEELPIPGPEQDANRISYPSVGNRFITWWDDVRTRFYVYDLVERQFKRIAEYNAVGEEAVVKASLSGDLLAYVHIVRDGERQLEWAVLPQ